MGILAWEAQGIRHYRRYKSDELNEGLLFLCVNFMFLISLAVRIRSVAILILFVGRRKVAFRGGWLWDLLSSILRCHLNFDR